MKKMLFMLLLACSLLGLAACNKTNGDPKPDIPDEDAINLSGDDFVIMCDFANRCDPRQDTYERLFRNEKIAKINEVEKKYNVKVKFVNYPSNASWGGARERWIVEQSKMGSAPAHVFEVSSMSIGTLATQGAILPLDDLIELYGNKSFWPEKKAFGEILGQNYAYDDNYPLSDDGIYYNSDLLASVLGEDRRLEPTEKWLDGTWTWQAFENLAMELKGKLDHTRSAEEGGPQYVLGGRTYNWAYTMIGSNGGVIVGTDFISQLNSNPVIETLAQLRRLYEVEGMWIDNSPLDNASQPEFTAGNVVFHNGQSWHIGASNKWGNAKFDIDFVPYPKGPRIKEDMSNYQVNHVYGKASFVISSSYSKANIPEGYENIMIYDEIIFKIWNDLMYFPEIDPKTGYGDLGPMKTDFNNTRLLPSYGSALSRQAHLSIFDMAYPDLFYSIPESQGHIEDSYMLKIQQAIREGEIRGVMEATHAELQAKLNERFLD